MEEHSLRGYLVIFVDGYKYTYRNTVYFISHEGKNYEVPDRLMPAEVHEIGSMEWWTTGWAVGDNTRDKFCSRCGPKPLKRFFDFDEAVKYIEVRQRKAKRLQFVLVYVTKDRLGKDRRDVVRSSDDISRIVNRNAKEVEGYQKWIAQQRAETKAIYPELELLQTHFGHMKALGLAVFLASMRKDGKDKVLSSMSKATFYRYRKELAAIGIELPGSESASEA